MAKKFLLLMISLAVIALMPLSVKAAKQDELVCGVIITHMAENPAAILEGIKPFSKYLTKRLGVNVRVDLVPDDEAMIKRLEEGTIHLGYGSNLDYIKIRERKPIVPFAKVVKGGTSTYNAILLVRNDEGIKSLADLRGKTFSYTKKTSSHGYLYPKLLVKQQFNTTPENFFGKLTKTKKDPDGILAVLYKRADAVGASSQTFAILSELMPRLKRELKVLKSSNPLVHGPMFLYPANFTDKNLIERSKMEVLNMDKSTEGKQVLLFFKIGGWTTASDSDYNDLRRMF